MTSIRCQPAVYRTIPLQQRTSSPVTTDGSDSLSAVGDRTVDEITRDRVCAPWCADRANHPTKVGIQERDCRSEPVNAPSVPGDVPKNLGVDVKLRLRRVDERDCLSIAIDDDDLAFISPEQARRIGRLADGQQARTTYVTKDADVNALREGPE
jgi:hypothetical protein